MLGYGAAVWVAYGVGYYHAMRRELPSRFQLGIFAFATVIAVLLASIAAAIPFVVARLILGARAFSTPPRAMVSGCLVAVAALPFWVWLFGRMQFDSGPPPYEPALVAALHTELACFATAGIAGGLVYWAVEFSSVPSAFDRLLSNSRRLRWTGNRLSGRSVLALWVAAVIAAAIPVTRWWWRPDVHWSAASRVPRVRFAGEWDAGGSPAFLSWSRDSGELVSLSATKGRGASAGSRLAVTDATGHDRLERTIPVNLAAVDVVGDEREIVIPGRAGSSSPGFVVLDLATGTIVHRDADTADAVVTFALSEDGASLAVCRSPCSDGDPIRVFDTHRWNLLSSPSEPAENWRGPRRMAVSPTGSRLALASGRGVEILDVHSGSLVRTIATFSPSAMAFSPDGTLLAATMYAVSTSGSKPLDVVTRVFRLQDGTELASRLMAGGPGTQLVWDPQQRFLAFFDGDVVRLWNPVARGAADATIGVRPNPSALAISRDGRHLAVGNGDTISVFRID